MENTKKCPKCTSEMEIGFMLDSGSWGTAIPQQQVWMEGEELTLVSNGKQRTAQTFRCKVCGYLESYAK